MSQTQSAVELDVTSAHKLVQIILEVLKQAETGGHLEGTEHAESR